MEHVLKWAASLGVPGQPESHQLRDQPMAGAEGWMVTSSGQKPKPSHIYAGPQHRRCCLMSFAESAPAPTSSLPAPSRPVRLRAGREAQWEATDALLPPPCSLAIAMKSQRHELPRGSSNSWLAREKVQDKVAQR